MNLREKYKHIIKLALTILTEGNEIYYSQKTIVNKLTIIGRSISPATLSNLFNIDNYESGGRSFKVETLQNVAEGLMEIIESELGKTYQESSQNFESLPSQAWKKVIIEEDTAELEKVPNTSYRLFVDGRRSVGDKINLFRSAQKEIIELGIRLKSFSSHFTTESDNSFREPVLQQLNANVNFKCYLLNPRGRFATDYFKDRAKVFKEELDNLEEFPYIVEKLKLIRDDLNAQSNKGKMSLHYLNTYPYLHASISDGDTPQGRMYVSPYLYGITRPNCPVMEIHRSKEKKLFLRYWGSVKAMMDQSKLIP